MCIRDRVSTQSTGVSLKINMPKREQEDDSSKDAKKPRDDTWTPESWRSFPIKQQPKYKSTEHLAEVYNKLSQMPPLVHANEVFRLKELLKDVALGKRFILQGGDCAERFSDCRPSLIENKLKILLQMSMVLIWGAGVPLVRIGRIAGQYMKPRSADMETDKASGEKVFSYKGDSINGFDIEHREPDPNRLMDAYFHAASTLNYLRALTQGGFADLHKPESWDLSFATADYQKRHEYEEIRARIVESLNFTEACGMHDGRASNNVEFFTSHEGLLLDYETALTRPCETGHVNLGAHFLWIGDRTRALDEAHIEYFRGIQNPIGIKVGPTTVPEELIQLLDRVNPSHEVGRVVLITRFGASKVKDLLPPIVRAVQSTEHVVVWQCDPMHGNTTSAAGGFKTRAFANVLKELMSCFEVHSELGTWLGGVHFELSGEDVTELSLIHI
eukprot:TRINITY_DN2768_c0_g1_i2.p1 TRINITY_DN2768_c0_g1~~TRINITY_DN2768_c0_g1_i2.p1  ORF type:complete len:444 (+),score=106.63 TRINITY_DN2768_c0_g1_i2:98-1429(+)